MCQTTVQADIFRAMSRHARKTKPTQTHTSDRASSAGRRSGARAPLTSMQYPPVVPESGGFAFSSGPKK
eukprot:2311482-Rhodomonas_salina.1